MMEPMLRMIMRIVRMTKNRSKVSKLGGGRNQSGVNRASLTALKSIQSLEKPCCCPGFLAMSSEVPS